MVFNLTESNITYVNVTTFGQKHIYTPEKYAAHDQQLIRVQNNPYTKYNRFDMSCYLTFEFTDGRPRIPLAHFKCLPHGYATEFYRNRTRYLMLGVLGGGFGSVEIKYHEPEEVEGGGQSYLTSLSCYSHVVHLWKANLSNCVHETPKGKKACINRVDDFDKGLKEIRENGLSEMNKQRFEYGGVAPTFRGMHNMVHEEVLNIIFTGEQHAEDAHNDMVARNDIKMKYVLVERYLNYLEKLLMESKRRGLSSGTLEYF